ncbi:peptidylprolyl isomerase, partial [uncultured Bacteroides sp.]
MKRSLLFGCVCCFALSAFAQEDAVLMRVDGREIARSEFEYSYRNSTVGEGARLSLKEYALLFARTIQKVEAAKAAGLDTTSAFRKQHEVARARLAETYLTDKPVMDSCARVQYQRMRLKTRNAQVQVMQIFRYLPQTITARLLEAQKNRMDSIYRAIQNQPGTDFSQWVERYSDDKQPRWIESLQTTAEFEEVAFTLSEGEISPPFFTP